MTGKASVLCSLVLVILSIPPVFATPFSVNVDIFDWSIFPIINNPGITLNFPEMISTSAEHFDTNSTITFRTPNTEQDPSAGLSTSRILGPSTNYYNHSTTSDLYLTAMPTSASDGNGQVSAPSGEA